VYIEPVNARRRLAVFAATALALSLLGAGSAGADPQDPKNRDIPINLLLIGEAYEKRGRYPEAMDYFQQCVVAEKVRSGHSPLVASLARNIERVKHEMSLCNK